MNDAVSYSHTASRPEQDKRGTIRTSINRLVDPWNLTVSDISIIDIANHLSCETRYNGAVGFYSVAQHSCLLADLVRRTYVPGKHSLAKMLVVARLHDAEEAYLKDLTSPVKHRPEMAPYVEAGHRARSVIFEAFDLSRSREEHDELMEIITPFDHQMYFLERKSFDGLTTYAEEILRLAPGDAAYQFKRQWRVDYEAYIQELLHV